MHICGFLKSGIFSVVLWFLAGSTCAQTARIDSLKAALRIAQNMEEKVEVLLNLCDQFNSLPADSLLKYAQQGLALQPENEEAAIRLRNFISLAYYRKGQNVKGLDLSDSLLRLLSRDGKWEKSDQEVISTRIGGLIRNGEPKTAIQECFRLLSSSESHKDSTGMIRAYTLLGWAYMELDQFYEAIRWLEKGRTYVTPALALANNAVFYANLASCYNNVHENKKAFEVIDLALRYAEESQNLFTIANALNIRADMYINSSKYADAEADMKKAIEIRKLIGDPLYIQSDLAQLSSFYASIGETEKGIAAAKEGMHLAEKTGNLSKLIFLHNALALNYRKASDWEAYAAELNTLIDMKDSLYAENSGRAIAEMEAKYELQKKENIIIKQNLALVRSRYLTIGFSILFLLSLLLGWALYNNYKLTQQRKLDKAVAEEKLLSFQAVEKARENERKRIAADLHDNLGSYAAAISANVKQIRDSNKYPDENTIDQLDENAKNIVTQLDDTIWVLKNEQLPLTSIADRFKSWMLRYMKNYPGITYHYAEAIEKNISFSPAPVLHMFMILKETITNAVKHSNCSDIFITVHSDRNWKIVIADNGKGFEEKDLVRCSGISNMKYRANESGWEIRWSLRAGGGTVLELSGKELLQNRYSDKVL